MLPEEIMPGLSATPLFRGRSICGQPWEYEEFFFFSGYGTWGSTPPH